MGLPSLPLTWWAENIGGPTDFGDYQIAHLPPPSASVGAARWAAIFRTAHYQRGTWERQRGWDAEAIPCGPFCGVVTGEQREIQRPWVFGGVFAPFCRRGQKGVAPEREISLWRKNKKRAVGDAGPYECVTRRCGAGKNPPVTASPCQPPLGKGAEGTGMRIATTSLRTGLAMTWFIMGESHLVGGGLCPWEEEMHVSDPAGGG